MRSQNISKDIAQQAANAAAVAFRKAGWRVRRHPAAGRMRADLVAQNAGVEYVVDVKGAVEGRADRLIPLLAQAILQAQAGARRLGKPARPLAIVAARRVRPSVVERITQFAAEYAPDAAVGVLDLEGFRAFAGDGLERLNASPSRTVAEHVETPPSLPGLFSDLNQWMLKILLGQDLPEALIGVPRQPIRNASQLAAAGGVSIMSASRFLKQLDNQGFLDSKGDRPRVVRIEELLELWISANRQSAREHPARWILKQGPAQITSAVREYDQPRSGSRHKALPRCCIGLFSAADALGFSLVHGAPSHLYLERLTVDSLARLGVTLEPSNRPADLYLRVPANREAVFRACVKREQLQVTDILQVWLDVSTHPARGREQAREILRRVLKPWMGRQR